MLLFFGLNDEQLQKASESTNLFTLWIHGRTNGTTVNENVQVHLLKGVLLLFEMEFSALAIVLVLMVWYTLLAYKGTCFTLFTPFPVMVGMWAEIKEVLKLFQ
mmetsp:Transcript_68496/g.182720  ORF Transcript_68496/g.182720 Transcript_68496/m.182720 type:complete len:103 (-) Transcript_68496:246-554(-)